MPLHDITQIYRASKKPQDFLINQWFYRPIAAFFVYFFLKTKITPNQITFLSLGMALTGHACWAFCPGYAASWVAFVFIQLAFILDCSDGQLARMRGSASSLGGHLDFLMDEIKAITLVAALGYRLIDQQPLINGPTVAIWGTAITAIAIGLTTFIRRPEFQSNKTVTPTASSTSVHDLKSLLKKLVGYAEMVGHIVIHYPAWIGICVLINRLDIFLLIYLTMLTLYLVKTIAIIVWRLAIKAS